MNEADSDTVNPTDTESKTTDAATKRKKPKLRWWQKLLLISFSFVILLIVELMLRLFSYGPNVDFVVTRLNKGDTRIMGINPEAYKRFHFRPLGLDPEKTRFAPWREFLSPKPAKTFRVFFLGGSSVEGYPHAPNGAAPAFLQLFLQSAWPDQNVEVINCGVTAINSFSLREWAPELLQYEPDMLVVYAGHNEFYGAYGAGSVHNIGTDRDWVLWHLWLRRSKLVQAVGDVVNFVDQSVRSAPQGMLMEKLVDQQMIRLGSATYTACRNNFRANLQDITSAARNAKIPIVLCGLVSNERDLVPMVSAHREGLTPKQQTEWKEHFDAGMNAMEWYRWPEALNHFLAAAGMDDTYAELLYRKAQCLEQLNNKPEAQQVYIRARDLDALRFRATAEFSDVVREVADKNNVPFVDTWSAFAADSPDGLIGWNLMSDHLHPTVAGHDLLARTICETIADGGDTWPTIDLARLPSPRVASERLGNDHMNEMLAKTTVYKLTEGFPYAGTANASFHDRLEKEILTWQASLHGAQAAGLETWSTTRSWDSLQYHIGEAYFKEGNYGQALRFFKAADWISEPHSLPAARARCGQVKCLVRGRDLDDATNAKTMRQQVLDYLDECARIHSDQPERFKELAAELNTMSISP